MPKEEIKTNVVSILNADYVGKIYDKLAKAN